MIWPPDKILSKFNAVYFVCFCFLFSAAPTIIEVGEVKGEDEYITPLANAKVGGTVNLTCDATGSPTPEIRWRHTRPNTILPNGIKGPFKKGNDFQITNIQLEDRGEYECIASNGYPSEEYKSSETTYIRMECKYS